MSKLIFRNARRPIQVLMVCVSMVPLPLHCQVSAQEVLPRPEAPFGGKIGLTYEDSEAVKPKLKIPATFGLENPPNILMVLIDDCGFGQMGTFGGGIPTPTLDRIANNGLKYTRFHTTALCSPYARGLVDRAKSSFGCKRRDWRSRDRDFLDTRGLFPHPQQPSQKSFASMAMPTRGLEKTTTSPTGRQVSLVLSIVGQMDSGSITSTDLSAEILISFTRPSSKTRSDWSRRRPMKTVRPITSPLTLPTMRFE